MRQDLQRDRGHRSLARAQTTRVGQQTAHLEYPCDGEVGETLSYAPISGYVAALAASELLLLVSTLRSAEVLQRCPVQTFECAVARHRHMSCTSTIRVT